MEHIYQIIAAITSILSISGMGTTLFFYKQVRKMKDKEVEKQDIENQHAKTENELEQANWMLERYEEVKAERDDLKKQVSGLYVSIGELKDQIRIQEGITDKYNALCTRLRLLRCDCNQCPNREPPQDFAGVRKELEELNKEIRDLHTHKKTYHKPTKNVDK